MLRVFIALNLLLLKLFACEGGSSSCINKVKHSNTIQNQSLYIPIANNKRLVFSHTRPKAKILKYDPFLALWLIEDKKPFKYPFKINMRYPSGIASVTDRSATELRIKKRQIGINHFAKSNIKLKAPAVLTNSCCSLEGIVTKRGIIEKAYIKRFLDKKDPSYADIGIRVKDSKKGVVVTSYDPFMKNNPFKKGDIILSMNGKKVKYASTLMRQILFSKIGSWHNFKVKRNGKVVKIKVKSQKRLSGGYKIETYLEKYGLSFDRNLRIIWIAKNKEHYGLNVGDRLLRVNGHDVKNQKDVMQYISDFKYFPKLLFERDDNFQFFVDLK